MRKIILTLIVMLLMMLNAFADSDINIYIEKEELLTDLPLIIDSGHTFVPARNFLEKLGFNLIWDGETKTINAEIENKVFLKLKIGSSEAVLNNEVIDLENPLQLIDGHSYLPLRNVAELLDYEVTWQSDTRDIVIKWKGLLANNDNTLVNYGLPSTLFDLKALYGEPKRITRSIYGFDWYTYHNKYKDFRMYGIRDNKLVAFYTKLPDLLPLIKLSRGESYDSVCEKYTKPLSEIKKAGKIYRIKRENCLFFGEETAYLRLFFDKIDNNVLSAVMLTTKFEEEHLNAYYGKEDILEQNDIELQLYDLVNADRVYHGLNPLLWHQTTNMVARAHSEDMKNFNYFDHVDINGNNIKKRLEASGLKAVYAAENIAVGQASAIFAHEELMNSLSHRNVILGPAYFMATGIAFGGEYHNYYTEAFYTPLVQ